MTAAIGLIAGGGQFPLLFAEAARAKGKRVVAIGHLSESSQQLENVVDALCWVKLGQLGKIISFFHKQKVKEAVFAGTITKTRIFRDVFPDLKALSLWNKIDVHQDDAILRAIAAVLEQEGIQVIASTSYLEHLLFPRGVLTRRKPDAHQMEDIQFGWQMAREIGRLDIGQCIVVKDKTVVAVEAIEGTDATIRRGGLLAKSEAVVVKVKKPNQDFRFDLPATGVKTIESLADCGGRVLAVEAGQSLVFDLPQVIDMADKKGIVVVGITENDQGVLEY